MIEAEDLNTLAFKLWQAAADLGRRRMSGRAGKHRHRPDLPHSDCVAARRRYPGNAADCPEGSQSGWQRPSSSSGVKNLYDGSVEMEVEGEEPLIDQLIIFLQNRTYVWIENMDAKSIPLEHDNGFYER